MQSRVCLPSCLVRMNVFAQFKTKRFEQFFTILENLIFFLNIRI